MPIYRAVSRMQNNSGVAADQVENTFYFLTAAPAGDTQFSEVVTSWNNFWNNTQSTAKSVGNFIANTMSRDVGAHFLDFYEMPATAGVVGPPVSFKTWSLPAVEPGGSPLPQELAIAVSYHADYTGFVERGPGGTRPRARRRGRFFVGPSVVTALEETGTVAVGAQTVTPEVMQTLVDASSEFATAMAAGNTPWQVFSKTDWAAHTVVSGWVDDNWDVQRRRGPAASSRITW